MQLKTIHRSAQQAAVYQLGIAFILVAFFGVVPALAHVLRLPVSDAAAGLGGWVHLSLLLGGLQLAYAVYVLQLPDWSTVWTVSLVALLVAAGYAMLASIALLAHDEHAVLQWLGLAQRSLGRRLAGWCVVMLTLTGLLAYGGGQMSLRWYRRERRLAAVRRAGSA
jgi:hypothetical protein